MRERVYLPLYKYAENENSIYIIIFYSFIFL